MSNPTLSKCEINENGDFVFTLSRKFIYEKLFEGCDILDILKSMIAPMLAMLYEDNETVL